MLRFFTNPQSRGGMVRWMLEEVGCPYEVVPLAYGPAMKAADYLAINPMGKVPAIVHEGPAGRQVVTECAAICAYLADAFRVAGLAPPPAARGAYYRWLFFAAGPVEAAVINGFLGVELTAEQQQMAGYGSKAAVVEALLTAVPAGDGWLAGPEFSAADVYAGSALDWGLRFQTLPAEPAFARYVDRLRARPAYGRAKALDAELAAAMA
jgi:glutathione S-transferase